MRTINKFIKTILVSTMLISSMLVTAYAEPVGNEQRLKYWYSSNDVHYFTATEEGEEFYVYCFNHDLSWPDRQGGEYGYTATYVPNDFFELSDDVKNKIHRIFYAGFPYNNAGLYVIDNDAMPTIKEMTRGLVLEPGVISIFPELKNYNFTYRGDGSGTLDSFNTKEAEILLSVGEKLMDWGFTGTAEQKASLYKIMTDYIYFFAFVNAYHNVVYFDLEDEADEYLPYFFKESLGSIGVSVTEDEAHAATQYAIWIILNREGVPNNTTNLEEHYVEGSLVKRLVDFAYDTTPIPKRNFNQSELEEYKTEFNNMEYLLNSKGITIAEAGGIKFTYNPADGKYYSEKLKFKLNSLSQELMDGAYISQFEIEVLGSDGNVVSKTVQNGKDEFVLVADSFPTGAKVNVSSGNYWPSPVYQYRAKSDVDNGEFKYQEMSGVRYKKVELGFETLALNDNGDLTVKKLVDNSNAAKNVDFWFDANITIKDTVGNQVSGWLDYTKYKLDADGNIKSDTGVNGKVYNYGKDTSNTPNYTNTKFSLKADEAIVIHNLPYGTTYTVKEYGLSKTDTTTGNWTPSYEVNGVTGNDDTLQADKDNVVVVSNAYKFNKISLNIQGTKTLKARADSQYKDFAAEDFSFILWPDVHGNPMPEDSEYNDETLRYQKVVKNTAPTGGTATFDFGSINFDKAGTYKYTIEEQQVTKENVTRDPSHYHVTVVVTENGPTLEKEVTVSHHNYNHSTIGEDVSVAETNPVITPFENIYDNTKIDKVIRVKKTIDNKASNNNIPRSGYVFEVVPNTTDEAELEKYKLGSGAVQKWDITTGDSGEAITPAIEFTDSWFNANSGGSNNIVLEYKITEKPGTVAGMSYSNETAIAKITITKRIEHNQITDQDDEFYSAGIDYTYKDVNNNTHTNVLTPPVFTNTYKASLDYRVKIDKEVISSTGTYNYQDAEKYEFVINDNFERNDKTGYKLPTNNLITLTYDKTQSKFVTDNNVIKFNKVGTYRFEISEKTGKAKGITYDTNRWILDIKVIDKGDGNLAVSEEVGGNTINYDEYFSENEPIDLKTGAIFKNKYTTSLSLGMNLSKQLSGRDFRDDDSFSFNVYHAVDPISNPCDPNNSTHTHTDLKHPLKLTLNKAISYSLAIDNAVKVHKPGKYYVCVAEDVPVDARMEYDSSVYVMEFVVEQVGNDLKLINDYPKYYKVKDKNSWDSRESLTDNNFKFVNKTTNLSVQKQAYNFSPATRFSFEITLTDSSDNPLADKSYHTTINGVNNMLVTDENGNAAFSLKSNETLNIADLPAGTKYTIKETSLPVSNTTIVVVEDGVANSPITGKVVHDAVESEVKEVVIVKNVNPNRPSSNKDKNDNPSNDESYKAPNTNGSKSSFANILNNKKLQNLKKIFQTFI